MNHHGATNALVRRIVWVATLAVAFLLAPGQHPALALLLLALGVPHGAADQLLHLATARTHHRTTRVFAAYYVLALGAYTLLWYYFPILALLGFVLLSVYHFGQTRGGTIPDQLIWGAFYLGFPILVHYGEARPIVEGIIGQSLQLPGWLPRTGAVVLAVLAALNAHLRNSRELWMDLGVLLCLYLSTDLLLGFAVYFLLWHSLPASLDQYAFVRDRLSGGQLRAYLRQLLPVTLAGLACLALAYALLFARSDTAPLFSRIFVMISLITLPHAVLVDRIYRS